MKVEEKLITKTVQELRHKITFSAKDIEELILRELKSKGYNVEDMKVWFRIKDFYNYDEQGMNRTKISKLDGAEIELPKGE